MSAREVELSGGAPWGFRMHGGADQNQPLRISRRYSDVVARGFNVNPGRKASLSGIREGDVISSINGRPTKGMNNGDAHAMLRSAGPVLRLGLNEDKDMSPRRRSIDRGTDLKRPSQLIADVQRATPQAPVYATIRPSPSPQNRIPSNMRSSMNSLPTLNSTSLVKSTSAEEPIRFHPTNPFYTTLPSYYSASKLPIPNGRPPSSTLDRNKLSDMPHLDNSSDYKPPLFVNSGPSSFPYLYQNENTNSYPYDSTKSENVSGKVFTSDFKSNGFTTHSLPNDNNSRNPFESKSNSNAFENHPSSEKSMNGMHEKIMPNSQNNYHRNEEITERSSVTEHKVKEIEEIKTMKKIILNCSGDSNAYQTLPNNLDGPIKTDKKFDSNAQRLQNDFYKSSPQKEEERLSASNQGHTNFKDFNTPSRRNQTTKDCLFIEEPHMDTSATESEDSVDSGQEKTVGGPRTKKYTDPKRRTVTKVSKKILKAIENLTCNFKRHKKSKKVVEPMPLENAEASPSSEPSVCKPLKSSGPAAAASSIYSPAMKPVWRPGAPTPPPAPARSPVSPATPAGPPLAPTGPSLTPSGPPPPPPPPPVWTPNSAGPSPQSPRKSFRPVHFEETPPARRKFGSTDQNGCTSGTESEGRLRTSHSAPASGLNTLGGSRLPRAQNPTVTLLQKAREGQIPRGSSYLQQDSARLPRDRPAPPRGDPVYALRKEYASEGEGEAQGGRKMADGHRKIEGIGPTTKEGMPVALRSEVKDPSRWYKKMYDTIHKNKYDDDYVTIRYKNHRGDPPQRVTNKSQYAYFDPRSGYLSEPEGGISRVGSSWSDAYDSDFTTGPRRRTASVQEERRNDDVSSPYLPSNKYSTLASARVSKEMYKNQPGRIENYVPGKSSVIDKEAKQWWDEVMDIFDGQNLSSTASLPQATQREKKDITSAILSKSNMARALKESGYESDSTLVFRRRDETEAPLSPAERRAAYRDLQAGGEPPLRGFRSPAPPRQDESEIEYIPISSTLTKIRVHKKTPKHHEVICYPMANIESDAKTGFKKQIPSFISVDVHNKEHNPPPPPRRVSSKNSRTLKLVTHTSPASKSPKRNTASQSQSNVDFLRDKISHKLTRQNTHIVSKKDSILAGNKAVKPRNMSLSAPPAISTKNTVTLPKTTSKTNTGTSSFGSPRRTLLPTEYNSLYNKYDDSRASAVIEGGAGRRTPITNILDKVTSLDKLWSSEKRNERIDLAKARAKSIVRTNLNTTGKVTTKPSVLGNVKQLPLTTHRSRDMTRTAEKIQKQKISNIYARSNPCLNTRSDIKICKSTSLQPALNNSKSSSNINLSTRKRIQVKTAVVTNLKKKKPPDSSVIIRPRRESCHEACSKKSKDLRKIFKKANVTSKPAEKIKTKSTNDSSDTGSQFEDTSNMTSNFGSFENIIKKSLSSRDIKTTRDAVLSDSFFQHLFLGNTYMPSLTYPIIEPNTTVLQKAKMFQSFPQDNFAPKSLNTYLIHRKPVSMSRFKLWDRNPIPLRAQSPRSISWPGRTHAEIRKFESLSKCEEYGSTSSLMTVRSKSEPPVDKFYFSQTSRPKSPTIYFIKKPKEVMVRSPTVSPARLVFSQTSRPVSPKIVRNIRKALSPTGQHSQSPTRIIFTETVRPISPSIQKRHIPKKQVNENKENERKQPSTMFFSQTSRPVSPKVMKKSSSSHSRSQSTSPVSVRSPSYRRIHSNRLQSSRNISDSSKKTILRTRSAGDADKKIPKDDLSMRTKSDVNLHAVDPDYEEYIRDMENTKIRSERFKELNRYYTYLERVGELERATSTSDLRHRRRDEEIVDFDRWKKIRAIERAEEELNNLYDKLRLAQNENDVLFYPRDVEDFRWHHDRDRGLRIKEKSVEDLKEHFQHIPHYDTNESDLLSKGAYKPMWRGTSVAETAFLINRKNEMHSSDLSTFVKPVIKLQQDTDSLTDLRKKIGLGNRLWSSLSMEQVNSLKNQLNAIYSKELESKLIKETDVVLDVKEDSMKPSLHVRCNSLITPPQTPVYNKELSKAESIAAIACPITSVKELKNNVNKIQMTLSENEKRKISQTISREVLNRINKLESVISHDDENLPLSLKQEIENINVQPKNDDENIEKVTIQKETVNETDDNESTNAIETERHVVFLAENSDTQHQSSASETETASSDLSNKTVIYRGPLKEVQMKVEYFESVKNKTALSKTIYHARENSDDKKVEENNNYSVASKNKNEDVTSKTQITQSQSCANFKELFGEIERNKFLSLPSKPELNLRSPSPHSEVYVTDRRTPDTLRYSSDETVWRSRSPSPDPERYWHAYLKLARAGEVRRLARLFDSPPLAAGAVLRRHRSDPELARNVLNYKLRGVPRVSKVPLRHTNRYMPHIDIISKLASLRRRTSPRSRSAEEVLECRTGEVNRIRQNFEAMSLLRQIYASAPDVRELRDIPYLAGPWTAHRFPSRSDNNRSLFDPSKLVRNSPSPVRRDIKRIVAKEPVKLSSILKSDMLAKQEFNPAVHRPAFRYEPPRTPPRPPPTAWPYRLAPFVTPSRHSVTFQESDLTPEPPRRALNGSYSDTESPRRYVENEVNIHYRCPVRHDPLPLVPERELARQQAEHMKRLYREQKRNKYLQELQDMQSRRHQDNFTPSQKNILPLNRYDEAEKIMAKALYAFNGQTSRELSFRKGDIIHVRRQIDANWYEGELHGRVGFFPYNYVELIKGDVVHQPRKSVIEGRARAKFDFTAQTNLELPLKKGELVVLTRRIDQNWWEGRTGNKTGIFPDSYVTVLQEPSQSKPEPAIVGNTNKPLASPAAHGLLNGTAKHSMGAHSYTPQHNSQALSNAPPATQPLPGYVAKPVHTTLTPSERGYGPPTTPGVDLNNTEPLYVDTNAEAIPYRAMYKYRPQNPDELELNEGDTVYVLEQCDDGWYVGSSQRSGRFGTFPGNYVERI